MRRVRWHSMQICLHLCDGVQPQKLSKKELLALIWKGFALKALIKRVVSRLFVMPFMHRQALYDGRLSARGKFLGVSQGGLVLDIFFVCAFFRISLP